MAAPPNPSAPGWTGRMVHRTQLFDSLDEAAGIAADLLRDALRGDRVPVLALLPDAVQDLVRARLGAAADAVDFLDRPPGYSAGEVLWDHLDARAGGRGRPFLVFCHDADADPHGAACLESEVRGNRLLSDLDEEHTCLYPRSRPLERIARRTHPLLREDGVDRPNPAYRSPPWLVVNEPAVAHLDQDAVVRHVVPHVDPDLRAWLAEHARSAGLPAETVEQFVLAGHEALRAAAESRTAVVQGEAPLPTSLGVARADGDGLPTTRLYLHQPVLRRPVDGELSDGYDGLVLHVDSARLPTIRPDRLPTGNAVKGLWLAATACRDLAVTVHSLDADHGRIRVAVRRPS